MSRIIRLAPRLSNGGLIGDTEGPETYLRELDTFPSRFARATGGTETVIEESHPLASLLLNFDGANGSTTFTDDSIYRHTVTANGDAQISTTESKFGGSSAAFDGTGDYLTLNGSSTLAFGTGDFTIEFWVNSSVLTTSSIDPNFIDFRPLSTNGIYPSIFYDSSESNLVFYVNAAARINGGALSENTWYHIAVARSSGSTKMFVDGMQVGSTYSDSNDYLCGAGRPTIGAQGFTPTNNDRVLTGYIDSLRIVKGQALYDGNFTPPASAPTNKTGKYYRVHTYTDTDPTSLLLNFDGSNGSTTFTDDSGWGHAVTANGNAQISTTQSKFGGSSAYFDGNGDYLTVPVSSTFSFGGGDFTIEAWLYQTGRTAGENDTVFILNGPGVTGGTSPYNRGMYLALGAAGGALLISNASENGWAVNLSVSLPTLNTWEHWAVVREGGAITVYTDGAVNATTTIASDLNANRSPFTIGTNVTSAATTYFEGYIDSFRVTKGQALYTAAFTPPTTALTRVGSGSLTFSRGGAVEYLVVGGGGGGGSYSGGGGGAGGYRCSVVGESSGGGAGAEPKFVSAAKAYSVSVGDGGAGGPSGANAGVNGSSSSLADIISLGGGGGGHSSGGGVDGSNGGSGGGGSAFSGTVTNGGSGTAAQGYDGGDAVSPGASFNAGGGGGAGSVGQTSPSASEGGDGGDGVETLITGSLTGLAGGGGGRGDTSSGAATDGGGAGGSSGSSATQNTGGGGGGSSSANAGGSGGSGIVIVRYQITQAEYESEAA